MPSPYITEILAWFNIDGYVFEVLPFMNKNLFEILIDRSFQPFDVRVYVPLFAFACIGLYGLRLDRYSAPSNPSAPCIAGNYAQL